MVIDAAADDDLLEVHRLLERHKLPIAGADAHVQTMLVALDDVPASVQSSIEFQGACPASAIVMRKHLANG